MAELGGAPRRLAAANAAVPNDDVEGNSRIQRVRRCGRSRARQVPASGVARSMAVRGRTYLSCPAVGQRRRSAVRLPSNRTDASRRVGPGQQQVNAEAGHATSIVDTWQMPLPIVNRKLGAFSSRYRVIPISLELFYKTRLIDGQKLRSFGFVG